MSAPLFTASGNAVFREPDVSQGTKMQLGFKVLTVAPYLKTDDGSSPAEEIARLLNLGTAASAIVEQLKAARATFDVAYEADGSIMAISSGNEALRTLVVVIDAVIAKAEGRL